MRKSQLIPVLLVLAAVCLGISSTADAQGKRTSTVLGQIPADAAGYVLINDLSATMENFDGLVKELGLEEKIPSPLLASLQGMMGLGDGFMPEKGLAVALLNFEKFKYAPLIAMRMKQPADDRELTPDDMIPPMVIYVPGKNIATTFPNAQIQKNNGVTQITGLAPMPLFAIERTGFIVMAMNPKVLDSIKTLGIEKSVAATLSKKHAAVATASDLYVRLNWKVIGPYYSKMMEVSMEQMSNPRALPRELRFLAPVIKGYTEMASEIM